MPPIAHRITSAMATTAITSMLPAVVTKPCRTVITLITWWKGICTIPAAVTAMIMVR